MKSKDIIEIKNINPADLGQVSQIANLYADVFAGPPWNEATKCPTTGSLYGMDTQAGSLCPDCSSPLLEAYPKDETVEYILGELGKTNPIGLLAYVNSELAGFSWGYQTTKEKIATTKWKTSKMQGVVIELLAQYGVKGPIFYGSETGVDPDFQGKGIGKSLVRKRLALVNDSLADYMLVRTNLNSPMYGICKSLGGWRKDVGEFTQIFGPVAKKNFLSKKYLPAYEYINGLDTENPDRVLFLYDKKAYNSRFDTNKRDYRFGDGMH